MADTLHEQIETALGEVKEGWCSPEKACAMADLIVEVEPKLCVEIGVFGGRSLIPQGLALNWVGNGGVVYGIDPWSKMEGADGDTDEANKAWWEALDINAIHDYAVKNIWDMDLQRRCVLVRAPSYACYELFRDIDILHIDGNHADPSARRDVTLYVPRVRPGGYVWFDDANWHQTQRAMKLMYHYCDLVKAVGDCNLYRRRGFVSKSQAGQDVFAYEVLTGSGILNGTFLDIGANDPELNNNTIALERMGWNGWLVDNDPALAELNAVRRSPMTIADSMQIDWATVLPPETALIDYLSLDVDEASLDTLKGLPLDTVKFRVITIEHDSYRLGKKLRDEMRSILNRHGYVRICSDVCVEVGGKTGRWPFEDWWVHPELVNMSVSARFKADNKPWEKIVHAIQIHPCSS